MSSRTKENSNAIQGLSAIAGTCTYGSWWSTGAFQTLLHYHTCKKGVRKCTSGLFMYPSKERDGFGAAPYPVHCFWLEGYAERYQHWLTGPQPSSTPCMQHCCSLQRYMTSFCVQEQVALNCRASEFQFRLVSVMPWDTVHLTAHKMTVAAAVESLVWHFMPNRTDHNRCGI